VAAIHLGLQNILYLGNLDARRDWGHACDYVEGMWRILQQEAGDDYVLATGETHTVRSFVEKAFAETGRRIVWEGEGVEETGRCSETGAMLVKVDPRYFRPTEVDLLIGDPTKALEKLGWRHTTTLDQMIAEMVASDLKRVAQERERRDRRG
jgi:GDPmannose 4,6-dehydratase